MNDIIAFLPCRKGSERIKKKNTRTFAGIKGGLLSIKLIQLLKSQYINKIILSTNDEEVIQIARAFNSKKIIIDIRPDHLASSQTSTDELIKYVPTLIERGIVLWTHVTSPFVDEKIYDKAIDVYLANKNYDSLMSVTRIHKFIWNYEKPINYNREQEKWPRTQTLTPLYEINSAIFLSDINIYKLYNDRIGQRPYYFELEQKKAFDIDWEEDFEIAEILWREYAKI